MKRAEAIFSENVESRLDEQTMSRFLKEFSDILKNVQLPNLLYMMSSVLKMHGYSKEAQIFEKMGTMV